MVKQFAAPGLPDAKAVRLVHNTQKEYGARANDHWPGFAPAHFQLEEAGATSDVEHLGAIPAAHDEPSPVSAEEERPEVEGQEGQLVDMRLFLRERSRPMPQEVSRTRVAQPDATEARGRGVAPVR